MTIPSFSGVPTLVGSFPHVDAEALVATILRRLPAMPAWPQLPARDFRESMYVQYAEGLPGAVVDREKERIFFRVDDAFAEALEGFYQAVVEGDVERFAISRDNAAGLHLFLDALRSRPDRPAWIKGQVTGPFSFAMTVTDEGKRSLAYTPELYEVAVQGMTMKARWMARTLRAAADGRARGPRRAVPLLVRLRLRQRVPRGRGGRARGRRGGDPRRGCPVRAALLRQHRLVARAADRRRRRELRRPRVLPGALALPRRARRLPRARRRPELGHRAGLRRGRRARCRGACSASWTRTWPSSSARASPASACYGSACSRRRAGWEAGRWPRRTGCWTCSSSWPSSGSGECWSADVASLVQTDGIVTPQSPVRTLNGSRTSARAPATPSRFARVSVPP